MPRARDNRLALSRCAIVMRTMIRHCPCWCIHVVGKRGWYWSSNDVLGGS